MWSDLAQWFASPAGQRALTDAVLPVVAVLAAAVLAGLIARAAVARLERRLERESLTAALAGFVEAARRVAAGDPEPGSAARLATESDVRLRFSGISGADLAAEWALRVALDARGDDAAAVRDRLLAWSRKPRRARRLFAADLAALQATEHEAAPAPVESPAAPEPETVAPPAVEERTHPAVAASEHTNQVPRPVRQEVPPVTPAPTGRTGSGRPAWLDDYDDDAHVTRNIPLSTPAPVAASAVRDRGRPDDIVPS
jgi:hypothetical protein